MHGKTQMRHDFLHLSAWALEKYSIVDSMSGAAARHRCLASMTRRRDRVRRRSDGSQWRPRGPFAQCRGHRVDVVAFTLEPRVTRRSAIMHTVFSVDARDDECRSSSRRARVTSHQDWVSSNELSKVSGNMSRRSSSHVDTAVSKAMPKRSVASA